MYNNYKIQRNKNVIVSYDKLPFHVENYRTCSTNGIVTIIIITYNAPEQKFIRLGAQRHGFTNVGHYINNYIGRRT